MFIRGASPPDIFFSLNRALQMLITPVYPVYGKEEKPVFFGHYWLEDEIPMLQTPNVCCLDYSVANNGKLVAYRFNGEHRLNDKNYVESKLKITYNENYTGY
jgi:hypothetical protein